MSTATPELLEKLKVAADKMGINITSLQKYLETTGVNVGDVNGLADLMRGVVAIAEGKEGQALTEELVHVATAIVEQVNPKLMTELISKINRFKIYDKTLQAYKNNKNYQTPDGKPDIRKIKKEAVDKLIAELIVNNGANEEQFPELRQAEERSLVQRMWDAVLDFIRGIYRKADIDIFRQVATNVAAGNVGGKASLIQSTKTYYQITDAQQTILNKLAQTKKELDKVDREDVNDKGEKIIKQIYVRTTAEGTKDVKTRVTDVVREKGKQSGFDEENLSLEERTFNAFKRDEGIKRHGVMEDIHKRYFNKDGN
jgi:spore coat protein CotF